MTDNQFVEAVTGVFVLTILANRPGREDLARMLDGIRKMRRHISKRAYRVISKRTRTIVKHEIERREQREFDQDLATLWGPSICN